MVDFSTPLRTGPQCDRTVIRSGSTLFVVLLVIVLLTLAAYTFAELMLVEVAATRHFGEQIQARQAALSGVAWAAAVAGDPRFDRAARRNCAELFAGCPVAPESSGKHVACFSIVALSNDAAEEFPFRFGLSDESAKLNVNAMLALAEDERYYGDELGDGTDDLRRLDPRARLLPLPGMTVELADAVLDWIDEDDDRRPYGAERLDYESLGVSYPPRNGPLTSLRELLLVRGVAPELLYGEDANRNGLLDPEEDDGTDRLPVDDADGNLARGWVGYLTVSARERNTRPDGAERINVNMDDLAALYDALAAAFGHDTARFIVAFRMHGPAEPETDTDDWVTGRTTPVSVDKGMPNGRPISEGQGHNPTSTRNGLVLAGGHYEIASLFDLVDVQVEAEVDGRALLLTSPWTSSGLATVWKGVTETLTVASASTRVGRIALLEALPETLLTIPEIDERLAQAIVDEAGAADPMADSAYATSAWLLTRGLVDLEAMRRLDRYVTAGGDVYSADVFGGVPGARQVVRLQAVIDATVYPARVRELVDLTELGAVNGAVLLVPSPR